jgi:hypothetical protein
MTADGHGAASVGSTPTATDYSVTGVWNCKKSAPVRAATVAETDRSLSISFYHFLSPRLSLSFFAIYVLQ